MPGIRKQKTRRIKILNFLSYRRNRVKENQIQQENVFILLLITNLITIRIFFNTITFLIRSEN